MQEYNIIIEALSSSVALFSQVNYIHITNIFYTTMVFFLMEQSTSPTITIFPNVSSSIKNTLQDIIAQSAEQLKELKQLKGRQHEETKNIFYI